MNWVPREALGVSCAAGELFFAHNFLAGREIQEGLQGQTGTHVRVDICHLRVSGFIACIEALQIKRNDS